MINGNSNAVSETSSTSSTRGQRGFCSYIVHTVFVSHTYSFIDVFTVGFMAQTKLVSGQLNDTCEAGLDVSAQTQQSGNHSLLSTAGARDVEPGPSGSRAVSERDSDLPPLKVIVVS